MKKQVILPIALATLFVVLCLCPSVNADEWNKKTKVTFDTDVEIPGQVLPAGTYVFKLFSSTSDRYIVQVWTRDEMQLLATLVTVGDSYPNPSGKAYFLLDNSPTEEGYPPALISWYFAGSDDGREFIYPSYTTTRMVDYRTYNNYDTQDAQPYDYQPTPQQ
ncbi:MAG TPA: hypothetical protein VMH89_02565 [Candidatus Acidoferrum sp.]|nr:hypothetical protein [Candidatus Acidoferrum sp.]